jgi:hypothetical protein
LSADISIFKGFVATSLNVFNTTPVAAAAYLGAGIVLLSKTVKYSLFDPTKEMVLACVASPVGLGCVLSHVINGEERPIAFGSRSLSAAERNYCQLEREGLALIYGLTKFHKYVYGRKIKIITDNKPITKILGPKVGIPSLAASRLQRWAMILMGHDYEIQYKSGKDHGNCDGLSHLPGGSDNFLGHEQSINYFSFVDQLPVSAKQVAEATRKDPVLSRVMSYVMGGWPEHCTDQELKPYFRRKSEMSCDHGCLMWGMRVIIPPCYRERMLDELHMTHSGVVKMKSLSRSYLWFPGLDGAIEDLVGACGACQALQKEPPPVPLMPWEYPQNVWERVHIDFFELEKKYYFLLVDAHSKWLEIIEMKNTTAQSTVRELRKLFALYGLPKVVVSDNGPQLTSAEMERFLRQNGVKHSFSPPYHPATNGAAERCVQTVKNVLKKYLLESVGGDQALQNFLLSYRVTPHGTTNRSPAEMFLRRSPRTRFSMLKPDVTDIVREKQTAQKQQHDANACAEPPS